MPKRHQRKEHQPRTAIMIGEKAAEIDRGDHGVSGGVRRIALR